MIIKKVVVGPIDVNCYVIVTGEKLYVVDPGGDADKIIRQIKKENKPLDAILLTHGHIDHISAVKEVSEEFGNVSVYLHKEDHALYLSPDNSMMPFFPPVTKPVIPIADIETSDFEIIHTPGHSRGSACFYFIKDGILLSGDTLFCESIGRTDLPGGDYNKILSSIKEKILVLPEKTKIYPGHGASSLVSNEKKYNPFLR
jgi:glyoxylase-like metal-dependent hydrolase (beta-lactamase superfamily II)